MEAIRNISVVPIGLAYLTQFYVGVIGKSKEESNRKLGQIIVRFCNRMGPLYVKLGQIMSTRSDVFAPETIRELQQLQDDVPAMPEAAVRALLKESYGDKFDSIFSAFDFQPLASASIAQVHKATLATGETVAVKLVKKNVPTRLRRNLGFLKMVVGAVHTCVPAARQYNLPGRIAEMKELLMQQIDMRIEANSQMDIHRNFKTHPFVVVPQVFEQLTRPQALVMEFMEGIPGNRFSEVDMPRSQLAQRLQDTIYTMLYMHGIAHGDPHPGNILFTREGKLIFLDFGITAYISEFEKWGISSFFYAAIRHEWDLATERFLNCFVHGSEKVKQHTGGFDDVKAVIYRYFFTLSDQWKTADFFRDVSTVLHKYGAEYTASFTKIELAFASCEGFATQIDPKIDIWANARRFSDRYSPYLNDTLKEQFDQYFHAKAPISMGMKKDSQEFMIASIHMNRYFFPCAYPIFAKRGYGCRIEDVDSNVYIDLTCGYGPHILGYAHPVFVEAMKEAVEFGSMNAVANESEVELTRMLVDAFPGMHYAVLSSSGTESVIHALRICRAYRGRGKVAKCEGHYHGFSDQAMVSSWFQQRGPLDAPEAVAGCPGTPQSTVDNTVVLQYGHPESLRILRERAEEIDCVILEPMPFSVGKMNVEYLRELRAICTELDIPLIFDEVVSGFRVAYGGAQHVANVIPDITCLGKIIGGGLPCGAIVGTKKLMEIARSTNDPFRDYETRVFLGGTMSGNALTTRAGVTVLRYLRDHPEIYTALEENTQYLMDGLKEVAARLKVAAKIKATCSVFTISFSHRESRFYREIQGGSDYKASIALAYYMRKQGIYMPELHTLLLSYAHTKDDLDLVIAGFEKSLIEMAGDGFFVN